MEMLLNRMLHNQMNLLLYKMEKNVTIPWYFRKIRKIWDFVWHFCGVIQRSIDTIFEFQWKKDLSMGQFRSNPSAMMHGFSRIDEKSLGDLEAGTLYPGLSRGENELRWGFIRKVYSILAVQILLTTVVSAATVLYVPINDLLRASPGLTLVFIFIPLFLMCPLYYYQEKHPLNFIFLGLFTLSLSLSVGVACANTQGKIVLEALILTSAVVSALTGYAFWAARKGKDFSFLAPLLSSGLVVLLMTSFIQIIFPLGPMTHAILGGVGAVFFSGFIIYDTENLIKRYTYDQYIWASVVLYIDVLNLFLSILNMLRGIQSDG